MPSDGSFDDGSSGEEAPDMAASPQIYLQKTRLLSPAGLADLLQKTRFPSHPLSQTAPCRTPVARLYPRATPEGLASGQLLGGEQLLQLMTEKKAPDSGLLVHLARVCDEVKRAVAEFISSLGLTHDCL